MTRKRYLLSIILLLAACTGTNPAERGEQILDGFALPTGPTHTPFQPQLSGSPTPTLLSSLPPFATPSPTITLWAHPDLPGVLTLPPTLSLTDQPDTADLRLDVSGNAPLTRWVYVLVAPFPTIIDGVTLTKVQAAWGGDGPPLMVGEDTLSVFTALWGPPSAGVRPVPPDRLLDSAWDQRPVWAIIPFESLEPRWKVLAVDGQSPLHKDFDPETYPLVVPFGLYGDAGLVKAVTVLFGPESGSPMLPASNRDPDKLTTVAMTGVTALVRATAWTMERRGVTYPAQDIGDWLRGADITHISNEVPFARDCPYPDPVQEGVVFCSDARYIELLEAVGTDVVELTGDHFHDWGPEAMLYTLELYDERGWPYYGGGANYEDGRGAALLEHNGNRFAFIGCNGKGGSFAQASATRPGAVACDFDWLHAETARLTREGYLVIATFQHFEYYSYTAPPNMQADFRGMAEAGAVIVSGSQAHHPHALEFWDGALLHFGLGNLFFDQYGLSPGTDEGFIDRHVFYDGRHISTELLAIVFVDYARPRPMTAGERAALLRVVFAAGGW